jgi:hypothetical protein
MQVDRSWLSDRGFVLGTAPAAGSDGREVLFAATSVEVLEAARRAETALCADDAGRERAATWLGEALGYPACCRAAFERLGPRDDLSPAAELLPVGPRQFSPMTQWLHAPLALISHTPCTLDCAPTRELAGILLDGLDAERPGFLTRWLALSRGVQVVDTSGRCFALFGPGAAGTVTVEAAVELHADRVTDVPMLVERTISVDCDEVSDASLRATLLADHRGE